MKYLVTFSLLILLCSASFSQVLFNDVYEGHWASESIYDLVKMGVTRGYPDGTFRGKKNISRYEIAIFLSKLAKSFNLQRGVNEKLISELKAETALIKYEREKNSQKLSFSGGLESRARVTSVPPRCFRMDYRLKFNMTKDFGEGASLKIGLDTVDAGFNSASSRALASRLLDVESKFQLGGIDYTFNLGPGVVVHTEADDLFPSENYTIYIRPKTAVTASTALGKMNLSASYVTRQVQPSGRIGVHELTGLAKYKFGSLALTFQPRLLFEIDGPRDILAEAGLNYVPHKAWETYILWGVGNLQEGADGMYVKLIEKILDPFNTGTTIVLRFDRVGSKYRDDYLDEYEFVYLNNFNRLILDNTVDLGFKVRQSLGKDLMLEFVRDEVLTADYQYGDAHPGTYILWQVNLLYNLAQNVGLNAFYRFYNVPSGTAQFSNTVPAVTDMLGMGAQVSF